MGESLHCGRSQPPTLLVRVEMLPASASGVGSAPLVAPGERPQRDQRRTVHSRAAEQTAPRGGGHRVPHARSIRRDDRRERRQRDQSPQLVHGLPRRAGPVLQYDDPAAERADDRRRCAGRGCTRRSPPGRREVRTSGAASRPGRARWSCRRRRYARTQPACCAASGHGIPPRTVRGVSRTIHASATAIATAGHPGQRVAADRQRVGGSADAGDRSGPDIRVKSGRSRRARHRCGSAADRSGRQAQRGAAGGPAVSSQRSRAVRRSRPSCSSRRSAARDRRAGARPRASRSCRASAARRSRALRGRAVPSGRRARGTGSAGGPRPGADR